MMCLILGPHRLHGETQVLICPNVRTCGLSTLSKMVCFTLSPAAYFASVKLKKLSFIWSPICSLLFRISLRICTSQIALACGGKAFERKTELFFGW